MANQSSVNTTFPASFTVVPGLPILGIQAMETTPQVQSYFDHAFKSRRLVEREQPLPETLIVTEQEVLMKESALKNISCQAEPRAHRCRMPLIFSVSEV